MRLHSLEMTAFGPYATPQRIDFDLLSSSGLFLLEGPTGAGKTTILDAVTYALYGGLAGEGSADDRLRSHFAGPDTEPRVRLEFSVRGDRYRITRVPEYLRPKIRGEGFTTQASQVHLERLEGDRWASLSSNKAETGDMVADAIGLTRAQFTQVMLLPQGEFARFLRARDDDRRELLTKLFGTQLYDRVTAELDRRRAAAVRERQDAERAVVTAVAAAAESAGLDQDVREDLLSLPRAECATRLKEAGEELARTVALTGEALGVAAAEVVTALAKDEEARRQAALMTRLIEALAALRAHEQVRPEHEQRADRLAAARRAEPVRPLLAGLADAQALAGEAREALLDLLGAPEAGILAGRADAGPDMLAGRGGAEAAARAAAADHEAAGLQHLVDREAGLAAQQADLAVLEEQAEAASAKVSALEEARHGLPGRISRLEGEWQQARSAAAGLGALAVRRDTLREKHLAASEAAELTPEVAAARSALQAAVDAHQASVDAHQALYETRLSEMAAELAAQIAEGGPCPVCGSLDHPAPACASGDAVSGSDIEEAAARRDRAEEERARLDQEHAALAQQVAALTARADGRAASDLAAEIEALDGGIAAAEQAAADAAGLEAGLAAARDEQETSATDLQEAKEQDGASGAQARAARTDLELLRGKLADAAGEAGSVAARQARLREGADHDRALARALDGLSAALADQDRAQQRAEREASARGFATLEDARAAVMLPGEQDDLAARVDSWRDRLGRLEAAVHADDLTSLDPDRADDVQARAGVAAAALVRAQEGEQQVRVVHEAAKAQAGRLAELMAEVADKEAAYDRLVEATDPVVRLAGLAKGTDGHRRVNLTTYVLRHWFSQVVAAANVRLSAMSSGRYELKRTDEGETRRERSGLTLAVTDRHTGAERSPASLSGGETFYTSLALALGLADVVKAEAGGVDLDTLFIDEGFGSLDADTLDQVMAVIDDLRERGRVVGIVSHVADLKDRVPERLEVRRLPGGSSAVRVVA
jgi:DNA repair protein SbcC/Rad50